MKDTLAIHTRDVMRKTEIKVAIKGMREYRVRLWLAKRLLTLASWIITGRGTAEVTIEQHNRRQFT